MRCFSSGVFAFPFMFVVVVSMTGCPAGDGGTGAPDAGDDRLRAVISGAENGVVLGETATLSAGDSVNPEGGVLLYQWEEADVPPGCDVGFVPDDASAEVGYTPTCLGVHRIRLTVSTFGDDALSDAVEVELAVLRPTNHVIQVSSDEAGYAHFAYALDARGTIAASEETLSFSWSVTPPDADGCGAGAFANATAANTTFTPGCAGPHTFRLTVADSISNATEEWEVTVRESLVVVFSELTPAPYPAAGSFAASVDPESVPPALLEAATIEVEATQAGDVLDVTATGPYSVTPDQPHLPIELVARARITDVVSQTDTTTSLDVLNNNPVLGVPDIPAFDAGATVRVTAPVSDADGDLVSCSADADDSALVLVPVDDGDDATCVFDIDTAAATAGTWTLTLTATDEFGGMDQRTATFSPLDESPVIESFVITGGVNYTCDAACTTSGAFTATVVATDDHTAVGDLTFTFAIDNAPVGTEPVELLATPGASPGEFDLILSRPDLGPMGGDYQIRVTVDDVDAFEGNQSPSTTDLAPLIILNTAPTLSPDGGVTQLGGFDHVYDAAAALFRGGTTAGWTSVDPEGNLLTTSFALGPCGTPPFIPGTTCTDPDLDVTVTLDGDEQGAAFDVAGNNLPDTVATYVIDITLTDADGAAVTESFTFALLNRAPLAGADQQIIYSHNYVAATSSFNVSLDLQGYFSTVVDPDGDPLAYDVTTFAISCPNGVNDSLAGGSGTCGSGSELNVNATNISYRTQDTDNIHGIFSLNGAVTDTVDDTGVVAIFKHVVQNDAPGLDTAFSSTTDQEHLYAGSGRITNEAPLVHTGALSDPNGDPLTYSIVMTHPNGITHNCQGLDLDVQPTAVTHNLECDFSLGDLPVFYDIRATDPFGASAGDEVSTHFLNRLPATFDTATFLDAFKDPVGVSLHLPYDVEDGTGYRQAARSRPACIVDPPGPPFCLGSDPAAFDNATYHIDVDVTDPDGDPLYLSAAQDCGVNRARIPEVTPLGGFTYDYSWTDATDETLIDSDGTVLYEVMSAANQDGVCGGGGAYQRYIANTFVPTPTGSEDGVACSLTSGAYITDQWTPGSRRIFSGTASVDFLLGLYGAPLTCN